MSTSLDVEKLRAQLERVHQTCELGQSLLETTLKLLEEWKDRAEGFEADDIIATAATEAVGQGLRVLIHSSDKDLLQLVLDDAGDAQGTVVCCSVRDGRYYRATDVAEKFGVRPSQMRDYLVLAGDSSDNIQGVPGIGPKKASELLRAHGQLEVALALLGSVAGTEELAKLIGKSCAFNLKENLEQLALARQLVTLSTDAPIDFGELFAMREVQPLVEAPTSSELDERDDFIDVILSQPKSEEKMEEPKSEPEASRQTFSEDVAPQKPDVIDARPTPMRTELALAPQPFELQLEPASIGGAFKLATGLFNSRLYSRFGTPEAIWAVIIRGREMGLGALTALDCFHVIEGKPALHAHLIIARAKALPECEYFRFVGGDATFAEYETKHRDDPEPTRLRYTYAEAEAAGVTTSPKGKTNWQKRPAEMNRKTCGVQLVRIVYPHAALGLYSVEELEGGT